MDTRQLFSEFLQRIQYPETPDPGASPEAVLVFDELAVSFRLERDSILLTGRFGALEGEGEERRELVEKLLGLSLAQAGASSICLDPRTGHLLLTRRLEAGELTPAGLEEAVEDFLNRLDFWTRQEKLLREKHEPPPFNVLLR